MPSSADVAHPSGEREIRGQMIKMVHRACDQGLMISSYGTVSVRWEDDDFLITPLGVPRWNMEPDDIVQVRGGRVEAGKLPSRSVALHQEIYRNNPKVNSIIITQPPHLMGFCTSGVKMDVRTIPESWIFLKDIPILPFGVQYEDQKTVCGILETDPAILLANDSVLVTGNGLLNAFDRLEVAEFSAKSLIMGARIGVLQPIPDEGIEELRVAFKVE
jgi:L-fuculose-phosphate aldolase